MHLHATFNNVTLYFLHERLGLALGLGPPSTTAIIVSSSPAMPCLHGAVRSRWSCSHRAGQVDAEWLRGKFQRLSAQQMPQRGAVQIAGPNCLALAAGRRDYNRVAPQSKLRGEIAGQRVWGRVRWHPMRQPSCKSRTLPMHGNNQANASGHLHVCSGRLSSLPCAFLVVQRSIEDNQK